MKRVFTNLLKICLVIGSMMTISQSALAEEKREVFSLDFGGNSVSASGILTTEPGTDVVISDLEFLDAMDEVSGVYYVAKSARDVAYGSRNKLENWLPGGDHTNEGNDNIGYFMMFDCGETKNDDGTFMVYEHTLPVSCPGVRFVFSAWMANMAASDFSGEGNCAVSMQIVDTKNDKVLACINDNNATDLKKSYFYLNATVDAGKVQWVQKEVEFTLEDPTVTQVSFKIYGAGGVQTTGWDFALDDIKVEVWQPSVDIKYSELLYKEPVRLTAYFNDDEFNDFFADITDVKYSWYYSKTGEDGSWTALKENQKYTSGSNLPYTIEAFQKDKHNGFYKLVVASTANMHNNLCSIQKIVQINAEKDEAIVYPCQDGTADFEGTEIKWNDVSPMMVGTVEVTIKPVPYTELPDIETYSCLNEENNEPGRHEVSTEFKYYTTEHTECVETKQTTYINISDELQKIDDRHICKGHSYEGVLYDKVENKVDKYTRKDIVIKKCTYEQDVYVHDTSLVYETVYLCQGDYWGTPQKQYNLAKEYEGGQKVLADKYGCDSTVITKIVVSAATDSTLEDVEFCSGTQEFSFPDDAGNLITYGAEPVDLNLSHTYKGANSNGCDSTVYVHLTVHQSGAVEVKDTICRGQIRYGQEWNTATPADQPIKIVRSGINAAGCPSDTTVYLTVRQVELRLRTAFGSAVVCEGTPTELVATIIPSEADYHWDPAMPIHTTRPQVMPSKTTTYTIYADLDLPSDVYGDAAGCHDTATIQVKVNPQPVLTVENVDNETYSVDYSITGGTMPYTLYVGKKEVYTGEEAYGTLERQPFGTHPFRLVDDTGCSSDTVFSIVAKEPEPAGFLSPNFDGENDTWVIANIEVYPNAVVKIYDRLGVLIYNKKGYDNENGFDGSYNGRKLPATDYWYEIDVEELDRQYVGHFTLLR